MVEETSSAAVAHGLLRSEVHAPSSARRCMDFDSNVAGNSCGDGMSDGDTVSLATNLSEQLLRGDDGIPVDVAVLRDGWSTSSTTRTTPSPVPDIAEEDEKRFDEAGIEGGEDNVSACSSQLSEEGDDDEGDTGSDEIVRSEQVLIKTKETHLPENQVSPSNASFNVDSFSDAQWRPQHVRNETHQDPVSTFIQSSVATEPTLIAEHEAKVNSTALGNDHVEQSKPSTIRKIARKCFCTLL